MPFLVGPPPISFPHRGPDGYFQQPWQRYFLSLSAVFDPVGPGVAPGDGPFVTTTVNPDLTGATNLGVLASGWIHSSVSGAVATLGSFPVVYNDLQPSVDVTIPANMGAIVTDRFVLAAGRILTLSAGAVFQIT